MTGYTVHTGATEKFVAGWDGIFKSRQRQKAPPQEAGPCKKEGCDEVARSKGRKPGKKKK